MRFQFSLLLIAATQLGADCDGDILRDTGFDLWCGDDLCSWKVLRGDVKRVDTWHAGDSGVELLGPDAAISQMTAGDHGANGCIELELLANVSKDATAHLDLDVYGNGSIDHSVPIGTSSWEPISFRIRFAQPYTGLRFELTKQGPGTAAFANIRARVLASAECDGFPAITHEPGPLGSQCGVDEGCESAMCREVHDEDRLFGFSNRCVACDETSCGADVCGVAEPVSPIFAVPLRCEPAGGSELGEQCVTGAECATGICTNFACSTCDENTAPCVNHEACSYTSPHGPFLCSPGASVRKHGEPCFTNADCASGACTGPVRKLCEDDGRPCNSDANCPIDHTLLNTSCITVGVTGGSCE